MNGPSFPSFSSSDNMNNSNIYNSNELNNYIDCSDEDFPISHLSSVLHNIYSSSKGQFHRVWHQKSKIVCLIPVMIDMFILSYNSFLTLSYGLIPFLSYNYPY